MLKLIDFGLCVCVKRRSTIDTAYTMSGIISYPNLNTSTTFLHVIDISIIINIIIR